MKTWCLILACAILAPSALAQMDVCFCGRLDVPKQKDEFFSTYVIGQPTVFFQIDTLSSSSKRIPIRHNTYNRMTLWVSQKMDDGTDRSLNALTDYYFDCDYREIVILNEELLRRGAILEANWICRGGRMEPKKREFNR